MDAIWYPLFCAVLAGSVELIKRFADHFGWVKSNWWPQAMAIAGGVLGAIPEGLIPAESIGGRVALGVIGAVGAIVAWHGARDGGFAVGRTERKLMRRE